MEFLNIIWIFFQDQILGMKFLNLLIGDVLSVAGVLVDFYDFIYPELFSTGKK